MSLLENKVAVVTGAGSGLGREYAYALAHQGAKVIVNDYDANVLGEHIEARSADVVVQEIIARGGQAVANTASVAEWNGAASIIDDAIKHFGRLDIVVNNAGNNRPSSLVALSEQDVDSHLDIHLKGTLAVSHFAAAYWDQVGAEPHRAIINTTSAVGLHPSPGGGVYAAVKSAIAALTVSHAQELASLGVRVNALAPAARTRMVKEAPSVLALMPESDDFDRHAPEHNAPLVSYLASSLCKFTGRVFAIEGPDVAIYRPFSVQQDWTTRGAWTPEQLAEAFADVEQRESTSAFFPNGVTQFSVPPGRTLRALDEVARSAGLEPTTF
jgi:NAD(P)-dependent dehydrogenase (short-subunit alcohol dehydrogenase family)